MLKGTFPIEKFKQLSTPFYYYDVKLLQDTLDVVKNESGKYGYHVHYAVKANANPRLLSLIAANGLGADCVSGGEVQAALDAGFPASKIVFAGALCILNAHALRERISYVQEQRQTFVIPAAFWNGSLASPVNKSIRKVPVPGPYNPS